MSELTQKILGGIIRWALTGVTGWLISHSIIGQGDVPTLVAGILSGVITLAWTIWQKYLSHTQLVTALASPAGTTVDELKKNIAGGASAPPSTPDASSPRILQKLGVLLLAAGIGLGAVTVSSCSGTTQLPNLPQVQATTDKDVRAATAKAYQLIGAALNVLDHADQYEATINKAGGIPANVHQAAVAGIVKAAKDLDAVNTDIGNKVLTTYAAIKARVDPIIADLNTLLNLTKSGGFDWGGLLAAAINLLMAVTNPGFGGSGLVPSAS